MNMIAPSTASARSVALRSRSIVPLAFRVGTGMSTLETTGCSGSLAISAACSATIHPSPAHSANAPSTPQRSQPTRRASRPSARSTSK